MFVSILRGYLKAALAFSADTNCTDKDGKTFKDETAPEKRGEGEEEQERVRLERASRAVLASALETLTSEGGWRRQAEEAAGAAEAVVELAPRPRGRTAYRLTATLPECPPARVWEQLRADSDGAGWLLSDVQRLEMLETEGWDGVTAASGAGVGAGGGDVVVQRSQPRLGGLVAPREFVLLRRWSALPAGCAILASASVDHRAAPPPQPQLPRGECAAGGWLVEPSAGGGTKLRWAVECTLGGWVPERAVRSASATYMLQYAHHLRARCCGRQRQADQQAQESQQ